MNGGYDVSEEQIFFQRWNAWNELQLLIGKKQKKGWKKKEWRMEIKKRERLRKKKKKIQPQQYFEWNANISMLTGS